MPSMRRGFVSIVGTLGAIGLLAGSALGQGYVYPAKGQSPQQQQKDQGECSGGVCIIRIRSRGGDQNRYHFTIIARTINIVPAKRNFSGPVLYFGHLKTP